MQLRTERVEHSDVEGLFPLLDGLVDEWCGRRALPELRFILGGYPMANLLTDGWHDLKTALENVRAFCGNTMSPSEHVRVEYALRLVNFVLDQPR
jgi:hypothetical protein